MAIGYSISTNKITVIGYSALTPCNFHDLYVADKAGTVDLWTGTPAMNITLTHQIQPSDDVALKIDFVLSGTNAGAGDTIVITGTDKDDGAQSETLTTTANGTFTTTKWFKTITDVDCNGFNTGTLTVRQNQWGVIWEISDYEFRVFTEIHLGDASLDGYFGDTKKMVYAERLIYAYYIFTDEGHGHLSLGEVGDVNEKTGKNGCVISVKKQSAVDSIIYNIADMNLYNTVFRSVDDTMRFTLTGTAGRIWDCKFDKIFFTGASNLDIFSVSFTGSGVSGDYPFSGFSSTGGMDKLFVYNMQIAFYSRGRMGVGVISNLVARDYDVLIRAYRTSGINELYAVDWDVPIWSMGFGTSSSEQVNYRQYTFNLKVMDKDGNGIGNATVIVKDKDGNTTNQKGFETTTSDADATRGKITEQTVSYGYYNRTGGNTIYSYSPHTLTISKVGYEVYKKVLTLDEKINWRIALTPAHIHIDQEALQ